MIDPTGMTPREWTDRMALLLRVTPLKIERDEDWRVWARHVLQDPNISRRNPPNPDFFEFEEWASRFNQVVPVN